MTAMAGSDMAARVAAARRRKAADPNNPDNISPATVAGPITATNGSVAPPEVQRQYAGVPGATADQLAAQNPARMGLPPAAPSMVPPEVSARGMADRAALTPPGRQMSPGYAAAAGITDQQQNDRLNSAYRSASARPAPAPAPAPTAPPGAPGVMGGVQRALGAMGVPAMAGGASPSAPGPQAAPMSGGSVGTSSTPLAGPAPTGGGVYKGNPVYDLSTTPKVNPGTVSTVPAGFSGMDEARNQLDRYQRVRNVVMSKLTGSVPMAPGETREGLISHRMDLDDAIRDLSTATDQRTYQTSYLGAQSSSNQTRQQLASAASIEASRLGGINDADAAAHPGTGPGAYSPEELAAQGTRTLRAAGQGNLANPMPTSIVGQEGRSYSTAGGDTFRSTDFAEGVGRDQAGQMDARRMADRAARQAEIDRLNKVVQGGAPQINPGSPGEFSDRQKLRESRVAGASERAGRTEALRKGEMSIQQSDMAGRIAGAKTGATQAQTGLTEAQTGQIGAETGNTIASATRNTVVNASVHALRSSLATVHSDDPVFSSSIPPLADGFIKLATRNTLPSLSEVGDLTALMTNADNFMHSYHQLLPEERQKVQSAFISAAQTIANGKGLKGIPNLTGNPTAAMGVWDSVLSSINPANWFGSEGGKYELGFPVAGGTKAEFANEVHQRMRSFIFQILNDTGDAPPTPAEPPVMPRQPK